MFHSSMGVNELNSVDTQEVNPLPNVNSHVHSNVNTNVNSHVHSNVNTNVNSHVHSNVNKLKCKFGKF